jgi:hypothetical protein
VLGSDSDDAAKARALRMLNDALGRLDRVRDARGDDEAVRLREELTAATHAAERALESLDAMTERALDAEEHATRLEAAKAARSPQSEDHDAPERIWTNAHAVSILTGSERLAGEMRALGDTLVEYVRADLSPSRDGTVAVEDWRTTAVRLASLLRELHPQNPYYREKQAEALAAFDALAGESNEEGNQ